MNKQYKEGPAFPRGKVEYATAFKLLEVFLDMPMECIGNGFVPDQWYEDWSMYEYN